MVRSLLQLSEIWPHHIWLTGRMKFASLEANLGGDIVDLGLYLALLNPSIYQSKHMIYLLKRTGSMRPFF